MRAPVMFAALVATVIVTGCGGGDSMSDPSVPVTQGFPLFGPGPHWIEHVTSGTVTFDVAAVVGVDFDSDGVTDIVVQASGPTTVFRSNARSSDAAHPRRRDHLDLEIVSLMLEAPAVVIRAGDGVGNLAADGPLSALGSSDELAASPQLARDEFEIHFAAEIFGMALHNQAPMRLGATIDRLPPIGSVFELDGPPVPLLTAAGDPSGFRVTSVSVTPLDPDASA